MPVFTEKARMAWNAISGDCGRCNYDSKVLTFWKAVFLNFQESYLYFSMKTLRGV